MEVREFNKYLKNADQNQQSFIRLYNEYYPKIVLHISVKFDESVAHDIAQDFFCKLVSGAFKDTEYVKSPVAYIYRVCDNLAINIYKKEAKYVALTNFEFSDGKQDIDKMLDIGKLLDMLDNFEKNIIYLHFFEGYSLKELAGIYGIKYDNFRKKYGAILKKLKKYGTMP